MPRNRKLFVNKTVLLITSRVEEGLPFVASLFLNLIIWGILAKARKLYPVRVCHFMLMANHIHLLLVVEDPDDVAGFMRYLKVESSHAINRLLGRRKRTVWCDGYDSPIILTIEDVQRYIKYIYLNPIRAKLVTKICHYPGVSSWSLYRGNSRTVTCRAISRDSILPIPKGSLNLREQSRFTQALIATSTEIDFVLEPDAWIDCFTEPQQSNNGLSEKLNAQIFAEIQESERLADTTKVIGRRALQTEPMDRKYQPHTFGRRMICICSDKEIRRHYISWYKNLRDRASEVFKCWKRGEHSLSLPLGLLAPGNLRLTNLNRPFLMA